MFIKPLTKYNKTTKERYLIYQLCESYRIDGYIRHRTIVGLGKLEDLTDQEIKQLGKRIEEMIKYGQNNIFPMENEKIEKLAVYYYNQVKKKRTYDIKKSKDKEWEIVDVQSVKNKDAQEVGAEWLSKQALKQLGAEDFLRQKHWGEEDISLGISHIISRAVYPASELKTV